MASESEANVPGAEPYVPPPTAPTPNEPPPVYQYSYANTVPHTGQGEQTMTEKAPLPDSTAPYPVQQAYPNQQYGYYQTNAPGYPAYGQNTQYPMMQQTYPQTIAPMQRDVTQTPPKETTGKDIGALIYSICACLFFFWPIGLIAIVFSGMALANRGRIGLDDKADQYTKYSLILSSVATAIGVILIISLIIVICTS